MDGRVLVRVDTERKIISLKVYILMVGRLVIWKSTKNSQDYSRDKRRLIDAIMMVARNIREELSSMMRGENIWW